MKSPIVPLTLLRLLKPRVLYQNRFMLVMILLGMLFSFTVGTVSVKDEVTITKEKPQVKSAMISVPPIQKSGAVAVKNNGSQFQELTIGQAYYTPSPTGAPTPIQSGSKTEQQGTGESNQWGIAKQIDAHTWSVKVGQDATMATAREIFQALNAYRQTNGKGSLQWNDTLVAFAQRRADSFVAANKLDGHAGFMDYVNQQDGFRKLGFGALGENSSIGYILSGTHLIEWVYAADEQHNSNQLDSQWTEVGIGVNASATDLVFGGRKL